MAAGNIGWGINSEGHAPVDAALDDMSSNALHGVLLVLDLDPDILCQLLDLLHALADASAGSLVAFLVKLVEVALQRFYVLFEFVVTSHELKPPYGVMGEAIEASVIDSEMISDRKRIAPGAQGVKPESARRPDLGRFFRRCMPDAGPGE